MRNTDIKILFCPDCNWKIINPTDDQLDNHCPKCNTWTFEIAQNYYYKDGKVIAKEFSLTDNDEIFITFETWKEAKRVIDKGFKLFAKGEQEVKNG